MAYVTKNKKNTTYTINVGDGRQIISLAKGTTYIDVPDSDLLDIIHSKEINAMILNDLLYKGKAYLQYSDNEDDVIIIKNFKKKVKYTSNPNIIIRTKDNRDGIRLSEVFDKVTFDFVEDNPYEEDVYVANYSGTIFNDEVKGNEYKNTIKGGGGNDTIYGYDENDKLYGGIGNDTLYGGDGDDKIYGGSGNDKLYGEEGNDTIYGDSGNDEIDGGEGNDIIKTGNGNNVVTTGNGNDTITLGKGNNIINIEVGYGFTSVNHNKKGTVTYNFKGISNYDDLSFSKGYGKDKNALVIKYNDTEFLKINKFFSKPKNVDLQIDGTNDVKLYDIATLSFEGTDKKNSFGTVFDDIIHAYGGADKIKAGGGNDEIYGGTGNDKIWGGTGVNNIYFSSGDGKDTVYSTKGGDDTLVFEDRYLNFIYFSRIKNNLVLTFRDNENDKVTISNYFKGTPSVTKIKTLDGVFSIPDLITFYNKPITGKGKIKGTIVGDWIFSSNKNDTIYGLSGRDEIYGNGGNDIIYGGDGDDKLYGGAGNNKLYGGNGDDYLQGISGYDICRNELYGEDGDDEIKMGYFQNIADGGSGNDKIYMESDMQANAGYNKIYGGEGDDIIQNIYGAGNYIDGGEGNDKIQYLGCKETTIIGGKGDDYISFYYSYAYGADGTGTNNIMIFSEGDGNDSIYSDLSSYDTIKFTTEQNLTFSKSYHNLIISYGNNDSINIMNYFEQYYDVSYETEHHFVLDNGGTISSLSEVVDSYMTNTNNSNHAPLNYNSLSQEVVSWNNNNSSDMINMPENTNAQTTPIELVLNNN